MSLGEKVSEMADQLKDADKFPGWFKDPNREEDDEKVPLDPQEQDGNDSSK